jgi:hypothetical protein
MKPLSPREAILRDQFHAKLVASSKNVFSETDLFQAALELRFEQGFPWSLSERNFVRRMIQDAVLKTIPLSATYPFEAKRYHYRTFTDYELALSLKPGGYLSHGTAALLHQLMDHDHTTIYINKEQSPKNSKGILTQAGIERAFASKQRQSSYIVRHGPTQIVFLNGKNSNRLGLTSKNGPQGEGLELNDVERTLIDIAVRPSYAGGAKNVARAYRNAGARLSVLRVAKMLEQLEYVYPYHQAIGFYLQNAGQPPSALQPLRDFGLNFDFYLEHGTKHSQFDPTWRIHFPDDIKSDS